MNNNGTYFGIDFGTTNSSMAWFNPAKNHAEIIPNSVGDEKTPSLVYYGENETLIGKSVEHQIEEIKYLDEAGRLNENSKIVKSIKRSLISPPLIGLPNGKSVRPVEVAATILRKLKTDAEKEFFQRQIDSVVITHPAIFDELQKEKIREAALLAGFRETELLEEPVAAALAFAHTYPNMGEAVLVYDLGGGTFDLSVVVKEGDSFRLAMETDGDANCGGDDFDQALYDYWNGQAQHETGKCFSLAGGAINLDFLLNCRKRKELLLQKETVEGRSFLADGSSYKVAINRADFENLIVGRIENTVQKTKAMFEKAKNYGINIQTIVLIGGSSRLLLVERRIQEELGIKPLSYSHKDLAVALGAAYFCKPKTPKSVPVVSTKEEKIEELFNKAKTQKEQGNLDKAIILYNEVIELEPKHFHAYQERAFLAFQNENYEKAINDFNILISLEPENPVFYNNRGLCYYRQGTKELCKKDFLKVQQLDANYNVRFPLVKDYLKSINENEFDSRKSAYTNNNSSNFVSDKSNKTSEQTEVRTRNNFTIGKVLLIIIAMIFGLALMVSGAGISGLVGFIAILIIVPVVLILLGYLQKK